MKKACVVCGKEFEAKHPRTGQKTCSKEHGIVLRKKRMGSPDAKLKKRLDAKKYWSKPEVRQRRKEYRSLPEVKAAIRESRINGNKERSKKYVELYKSDPEIRIKRLSYMKEYIQRPEVKQRIKDRAKWYRLDYRKRPHVIEYRSEYNKRPNVKSRSSERYFKRQHTVKLLAIAAEKTEMILLLNNTKENRK